MDVNCGTLPSPPSSLCAPYPSLFPPPPSPSELGFYSHHSAFPFIAAAAASSNHSGMIFNYFSFIIRLITCFSYVLMISLDHQNKMADYLKNWPFYSNDFIRSYEIVRNQKSSDRSKCTNYVSNLPRFGSLLQK